MVTRNKTPLEMQRRANLVAHNRQNPPNLGRKFGYQSEEHRTKISAGVKNAYQAKGGYKNTCLDCGIRVSTRFSIRCKSCAAKGSGNPNYKNGKHKYNTDQRILFRKKMQHKVFFRDNYTCTFCGSVKNLQVDHIKRWSEYPELRFDIDNCRTLCMACHYYITFKRKLPIGVIWGHNLSKRVTS